MKNQSKNEIYSLIWMLSPYKIGKESYIKFTWSTDYSFFWFSTGGIKVGFTPLSGGQLSAAFSTKNWTNFDIKNDTPGFSTPTVGVPPNVFVISCKNKVPNSVFSTGVGMSNFATFIKQSYVETTQNFSDETTFWIAATSNKIELTEILSQNVIPNSSKFIFPINIFSLKATLTENNLWEIQ